MLPIDITPSPFDRLLLELSGQLFRRATDGSLVTDQDRLYFLVQQLGLLRESYVPLVEVGRQVQQSMHSMSDGTSSIPFEVLILVLPQRSRRVLLNYESFINVLCQMSRVLPVHFPGAEAVPRFDRVRFYRNKTIEHWDVLTKNVSKNSFTVRSDKAAIPVVEGVQDHVERIQLLATLKIAFTALGASLEWPDDKTFNLVSADPGYCEAVFAALEKVPRALVRKSGQSLELDRVITLLLDFGFPTPILDIEEYGLEIDTHIRRLL